MATPSSIEIVAQPWLQLFRGRYSGCSSHRQPVVQVRIVVPFAVVSEYRVHVSFRTAFVRVGVYGYNTERDVDRLVDAVRDICEKL